MPRRPAVRQLLRGLLVAAVLGLLTVVLLRNGAALRRSAQELSPVALGLALLAVLAGLGCGMLAWRTVLADLGSPVPLPAAMRIFFLGQLGKYVPGSVWPIVAQMELGREYGVPRTRSGVVGLVAVALSLVAGLLVAAVTLPFLSAHALAAYWPAFLAVPVLGVGLLPVVLNPVLDRLLRLARRGGLERPLSGRGVLTALGWSGGTWACFGLQVWLLLRDLGPARASLLPLAVGAFALAWTVGFLVVVAPAGAGVREVVLVLALAPGASRAAALLVALTSRALMTLGDLVWAGAAVLRSRRGRSARDAAETGAGDGAEPGAGDGVQPRPAATG